MSWSRVTERSKANNRGTDVVTYGGLSGGGVVLDIVPGNVDDAGSKTNYA